MLQATTLETATPPEARRATRAFRVLFFGGLIGLVISVIVGSTLQWAKFKQDAPIASELPVMRQLPAFSMIDQNENAVSLESLEGNVWVADFIFTRCANPCPLMTRNMADMQQQLSDVPGVRFVSFTLDPEYDTPKRLGNYADLYGANGEQWHFLTGAREEAVYDLALKGFALTAEEAVAGRPIIHSQRFVLVDRQGRIRQYYQGEDPASKPRIVEDVKGLLAE